jgi:autotransporter-associated beta strand protein
MNSSLSSLLQSLRIRKHPRIWKPLGTSVAALLFAGSLPAGAQQYWDVNGAAAGFGGTGFWNTALTNWNNASGTGAPQTWLNTAASDAFFQDVAGVVTINQAGIQVRNMTFDKDGYTIAATGAFSLTLAPGATMTMLSGTDTATISAPLVTTTGFTKDGLGTVVLSGSNTYTGATTVTAGTLKAGSLTGFSPNSRIEVATLGVLDLGGFSNSIGSLSDGGTVGGSVQNSTPSAATLTMGGDKSDAKFAGLILDGFGAPLSITKLGAGRQTFAHANTYTGDTTLSAGSLFADDPAALSSPTGTGGTAFGTVGTLRISGGTTLGSTVLGETIPNDVVVNGDFTIVAAVGSDPAHGLNNDILLTGNVDLGGSVRTITGTTPSAQVHFSGSISDGGITLIGTAPYVAFLYDTSTVNTYTGLTTIGANSFLVLNKNGLNTAVVGDVLVAPGGSADYFQADQIADGATVTVNSTGLSAGGSQFQGFEMRNHNETISVLMGNGTVGLGSGTLTVSSGTFTGAILDGGFGTGGNLVKVSGGLLTLSGANTYTGTTSVNVGTLQIGDGTNGSLTGAGGAVTIAGGATLSVNMADFSNLSRAINNAGTINGLAAGTNSNVLSGDISGAGVITQNGTGRTILSGTNTYTGKSTVNAGTLQFVTKGSLYNNVPANWNTTNLDVKSGATMAFNVGGAGEFTAADIDTLAAVASAGGGFESGSSIGIDTTAVTGGSFTYGSNIVDPNGGANSLGIGKYGANTLVLTGTNSNTGMTTVHEGTLLIAKKVSLYNNTPAQWTDAKIVVNSGATLAFNVGGAGEFSSADIASLSALGTATGGFKDGSHLGLDTTNEAGGIFTHSAAIMNPNGGANALGLDKLGTNTLLLTGANTYTGPTNVVAGTLQIGNGTSGSINGAGAVSIFPGSTLVLNLADGGRFANNVIIGGVFNQMVGDGRSNTLSGIISGPGAFNHNGAGTTNLTGASTYTGDTTINKGAIVLDGSLQSPNVFVKPGALLGGKGTAFGIVTNEGTVSPGRGIGTLTAGNYLQKATGTLVVEIAGADAGQHDVLAVSGQALIEGNLRILKSGGGRLKVGDNVTFLTAKGGVTGRFATVTNPFSNGTILLSTILYQANSVSLLVEQGSFAALQALSPNQRVVANVLDDAVAGSRQKELIDYLNTRQMTDLPGDFDRIAPEELAAIFNVGVSLANVQTANLHRRMDDIRAGSTGFSAEALAMRNAGASFGGEPGSGGPTGVPDSGSHEVAPPATTTERRWGAFISGTGEFTSLGNTDNARGYELSSGGFTLGVDYRLLPNFAVGFMAGYANTGATLANSGRLSVDGGKVGVYATYFNEGIYADAAIMGGINSYSVRRSALLGTARGSTDGGEVSVMLGGGYDWKNDALTIGLTANFQYTYVGIGGYTESGSLAPLRYGSQSADSVRLALGGRAFYDWKVRGILVRPELRAAWQQEFGDSAYTINSSFANGGGRAFNVTGPEIGHSSMLLGAGVAVVWNERLSTYVYYDGELLRENYTSHNISGGARWAF